MAATPWQIGEDVRVRGRRWTLRDVAAWPACTELRLSAPRQSSVSLLAPFDRPTTAARTSGTRRVHPRRLVHVLRRAGAGATPFGGSTTAAGAAVRLLAHQLEPMLAMIRHGVARLLIADAVGLGKTIQAGLILLELAAREVGLRALVLVPAGLRAQWRQELEERFALEVQDADASWLRRAAADRPSDVNPWSLPGIYLTSIDFAKRPEVLRSLEDTAWDLVVLDEAHAVTSTSDRRRAAHALACRSRRVLLLTATPDTGDPSAFTSLCSIGALDPREPPIVIFRRTRDVVFSSAPRRSVLLRVRPTPAEQRMHDLLDRYTSRVWTEASSRSDAAAKLATVVLRKRALSSAASLAVSAARRLQLLSGLQDPPEQQLVLPLGDEDPLADTVTDQGLAAPGLTDVRQERRWLASIVEAARLAARGESKSTRLVRLLARLAEPVIVFTEYRDTLDRLERLVRATGRRVETMHGGMERTERERVHRAFNQGGSVLLATDAASEGLNLHHACRIVIHYELPWRPARIEQRVGRIDRLGQTKRVHEIALVAAGTAERLVLAPLLARVARARATGGSSAGFLESLTDAAVLELVMGAELRVPDAVSPVAGARTLDLREEARAEVGRLEQTRTYLARSPPREPAASRSPTVVAHLRSSSAQLRRGVAAVFAISLTDDEGRAVHREVIALQLDLAMMPGPGRGAFRSWAETVRRWSLDPDHALHERVTQRVDAAEAHTRTHLAGEDQELAHREEALRRTQPSAAAQMVQAGLFDRRALAASARATAVWGALLEAVDTRLHARERARLLRREVEIVAVLVVGRPPR
ncbi:MAG: helicase-related protein [Vicinamibacterales bacterium]